MENDSDSFVRWQGVTREQLGATTNLVFGLATGLMAFQVTLLLDRKLSAVCSRGFGLASLLILGLSVFFSLWCSLNRLADFRLTAQIAYRRESVGANLSELREELDALGRTTWLLFRAQCWTFSIGALAAVIAVLLQLYGMSWDLINCQPRLSACLLQRFDLVRA